MILERIACINTAKSVSLCLYMEAEEKIAFKFLGKQSQTHAKDSCEKGLKTLAIDS